MNDDLLIDAISHLDEGIIEHYFQIKSEIETKKKRKKVKSWIKWASAAACFVILTSVSIWLFGPIHTTTEHVGKYFVFQNDDGLYVHYEEVNDLNRFQLFMLKSKMGELYYERDGSTLYTLKGRHDLGYLILRKPDGELKLLKFNQYFSDEGTDNQDITLGYIFETIYNIRSADDVKSIVFEKSDWRKRGEIQEDVYIERVRVTDRDSIQGVLSILNALKYSERHQITTVTPNDERYLNGEMPLSAQTERTVTITSKDNSEIKIIYYPFGNCVTMNGVVVYGSISDKDQEWLINIAQIDMEYHFYGVPDNDDWNAEEEETASRPRIE